MPDRDHDSARDLLGRALAGEPPIGLRPEGLAAAGRRRLHRRRAGATVAGLVTAGLALAGLAALPTAAGPQLGDPVPVVTTGPPGAGCGPDPGPRPPAGRRALPSPEDVTAAVRSTVGDAVRERDGGPVVDGEPVTKYFYRVGAASTIELQATAAGDPGAETVWAVAWARHECREPVRQGRPDGVSTVVTTAPDGHLVVAVGNGLRIVVQVATPDGATPALSERQALDLAVAVAVGR